MTDRSEMFDRLKGLIEPFNKKGVEVTEATTFAGDLEWDSLYELASRNRKCRASGGCSKEADGLIL
jgi:hypothetical protein